MTLLNCLSTGDIQQNILHQGLGLQDIKNLSHVNRGLYDYMSNPMVAEKIWKPLVPSFPAAAPICERYSDIIERGSTAYFFKEIQFVSLNERCVAWLHLREQEIDPKRLPKAAMPGRVSHVFVKAGDNVSVGTHLLNIKAMKMQHAVRAEISGTIHRIFVSKGYLNGGDQILALIV